VKELEMQLTKRDASAILLGLVLGVIGTHAVEVSAWAGRIDWPKTFESLAHICQAVGLVVAGTWAYYLFIRQRLGWCRIDVEHYVQTQKLDDHYLVRVLLEIKNVGSVLVQPSEGLVRLEKVAPAETGVSSRVAGTSTSAEQNWLTIREYKLDLSTSQLQLEPTERERYAFDFFVPQDTKAVQVYSKIYFDASDPKVYLDLATLHPVPSHSRPA
jgi:hypothetical protein